MLVLVEPSINLVCKGLYLSSLQWLFSISSGSISKNSKMTERSLASEVFPDMERKLWQNVTCLFCCLKPVPLWCKRLWDLCRATQYGSSLGKYSREADSQPLAVQPDTLPNSLSCPASNLPEPEDLELLFNLSLIFIGLVNSGLPYVFRLELS